MAESTLIECPFQPNCDYKTTSEYQIMLHMETLHSEDGRSPFMVTDDASIAAIAAMDDEPRYSICPVEGCGEQVLWMEFDNHIDFHTAEQEQESSSADESSPAHKKVKLGPKSEPIFDNNLPHALRAAKDDGGPSSSNGPQPSRRELAKEAWKALLRMPPEQKTALSSADGPSKDSRRRLGVSGSSLFGSMHHEVLRVVKKSELGPHANEKQMPSWLVDLLERKDGEITTMNRLDDQGKIIKVRVCPNRSEGILPVLHQLLTQDENVDYAYLCHPVVKHVSSLKREGGFCGYRNIQTMSSYIVGVNSQGHEALKNKIPTIFEIQDHIETAWDLGINSRGRIETGGIRGTRKYIGTPEAEAMFSKLGVACDTTAIKASKPRRGKRDSHPEPAYTPSYQLLFQHVERYFTSGCTNYDPKIRCTLLPPIYFQHPGHSLTIIGFEKLSDGTKNLLVFDPMYRDPPSVTKHVGRSQFIHKSPEDALKLYRRGKRYLSKYNAFETLILCPPVGQKGDVEKPGGGMYDDGDYEDGYGE
ncbi:hypothetical protein HYFRA_00001259 [Hymenoscyphus fraxineus]|uniref:UFSP1/2/DUB catalytic domain-containing protein n=1 Tax=Hymenoscyphus fraxineus TaxID=746836 RepID=A0A9N9PTP3_9HELO|nr:hypothetical protein HYFRA_00001259 [Hymenoscyphus fraxineus]